MVAYQTGSNPIEIGDLGSKVKVTVTENVFKNDEKNSPKIHIKTCLKNKKDCLHRGGMPL